MEKGNTEMAISFGLVDGADVLLSNWNGGILGPHGVSFFCCFVCRCRRGGRLVACSATVSSFGGIGDSTAGDVSEWSISSSRTAHEGISWESADYFFIELIFAIHFYPQIHYSKANLSHLILTRTKNKLVMPQTNAYSPLSHRLSTMVGSMSS